jgi:hypothetical protein
VNGKVDKRGYAPTSCTDRAGRVIIFGNRGLVTLPLFELKVDVRINGPRQYQVAAGINTLLSS